MTKYYVESGSLKLTIFAESAHEAAQEAVAWWGDRPRLTGESFTGALADEVRVRRSRTAQQIRRFATVRLKAQASSTSINELLAERWCAA